MARGIHPRHSDTLLTLSKYTVKEYLHSFAQRYEELEHHNFDYSTFSFFVFFFAISWATPTAYGGSQARGLVGFCAMTGTPPFFLVSFFTLVFVKSYTVD